MQVLTNLYWLAYVLARALRHSPRSPALYCSRLYGYPSLVPGPVGVAAWRVVCWANR